MHPGRSCERTLWESGHRRFMSSAWSALAAFLLLILAGCLQSTSTDGNDDAPGCIGQTWLAVGSASDFWSENETRQARWEFPGWLLPDNEAPFPGARVSFVHWSKNGTEFQLAWSVSSWDGPPWVEASYGASVPLAEVEADALEFLNVIGFSGDSDEWLGRFLPNGTNETAGARNGATGKYFAAWTDGNGTVQDRPRPHVDGEWDGRIWRGEGLEMRVTLPKVVRSIDEAPRGIWAVISSDGQFEAFVHAPFLPDNRTNWLRDRLEAVGAVTDLVEWHDQHAQTVCYNEGMLPLAPKEAQWYDAREGRP